MQQNKPFFPKKSNVPSLDTTIDVLRKLNNSKIIAINIIMWPPLGESDISKVITSANFITESGLSVLIDTASNQYTALAKIIDPMTPSFEIGQLIERFQLWSSMDENSSQLANEVFGVMKDGLLSDLLGSTIDSIFLLNVGEEELNPFALKLSFSNGAKMHSYSNTYGNFIQADDFMNFREVQTMNSFLGECYEIDIAKIG